MSAGVPEPEAAADALPAAVAALVRVSGALASRDRERLESALGLARRDADAAAVEEALLQSYLFLGYPAALDGLALWRRMSGEEAGGAAKEGEAEEPRDPFETWAERGAEVCRAVYGGQYEALRENIRALHPDMERWMVVEGYGKVLGRPGLPLRTRELCIVGLLAVLGAPAQLYSHLRGALNVGAGEAEVEEALRIVEPYLEAPGGREVVRETWERVRQRTRTGGNGS